jgi:hypothetical protein
MSALFAALIGFYAIRKTIFLMGLTYKKSIFVAFLTLFATNVFYYATAVPSMGHIFSFSIMALIVYTTKKLSIDFKFNYLYQLSFLFGLLILIRPTNAVIILLLPFIFGSTSDFSPFVNAFKKHKIVLVKTILMGCSILALLPILWLLQTGKPLVWSYTGEGFYWSHPLPHKVLFSFRNGLFIWTPIAFVALFGLYYAYKNVSSKWLISFAIGYFVINLYIISSWWTYYYGGGFGHRVYVEHQVFTAILLGYLFLYLHSFLKKALLGLSVLFVSLNVAQAIQMNKGIMPQDYVNWEMYTLLFLKFDDKWKGECKATLDGRQYGEVVHIEYLKPITNLEEPEFVFNENREFGGDVIYEIPNLDPKTQLFLEYNFEKIRFSSTPFNDVYLVVDGTNDKGETVFYEAHELYHIRSEAFNEWKPLKMSLQLSRTDIKTYKIYIWNQGRQVFNLKNIDAQIQHILP